MKQNQAKSSSTQENTYTHTHWCSHTLWLLFLFLGCFMSQQHEGCISGMDLLRQFYLPHSDRSCRSNFPSHPVHSTLTPDGPVPALTLQCQVPDRVATRVPLCSQRYGWTGKSGHESLDLPSWRWTLYHSATKAVHTVEPQPWLSNKQRLEIT